MDHGQDPLLPGMEKHVKISAMRPDEIRGFLRRTSRFGGFADAIGWDGEDFRLEPPSLDPPRMDFHPGNPADYGDRG